MVLFHTSKVRKKPYLVVLLYGREQTHADEADKLRDSPWHELSAAAADVELPLSNLPVFLKTFQSATAEEKSNLLLSLHTAFP